MTVITKLSGNELYCLAQKNYIPGNIVIGNSVNSPGFSGKIESVLTGVLGKELKDATSMLNKNRQNAYQRMLNAAASSHAAGVINVNSRLLFHWNNNEFITSGSAIHTVDQSTKLPLFSASVDGKQFYAMLDAEYTPIAFVFGNIAYATAMTGGIIGKLSTYKKGEVKSLSDTFNQTRRLALARLIHSAQEKKANAVVDIKTTTLLFTGMNEMLMTGTAVQHPLFSASNMMTSTLSCDEVWNLAKIGYAPKQLLLGTAIFSVGFIRNLSMRIKSLYQDEIPELTDLFQQARKNALAVIDAQAQAIHAETVIGIKTYTYYLGNGLIEFLAIGTAVEKLSGIKTISTDLPTALFQVATDCTTCSNQFST